MKAETLLAELDRLRKDLKPDPTNLEWLALHHAFCFISYRMNEFRAYVEQERQRGAFDQYSE
jgi:hypothetical protein